MSTPPTDPILYHGRFLDIRHQEGWEYCDRANASAVVAVVPVIDHCRICLVEQYRKPVRASVIECPAGLVGDEQADEPLIDAAERELLEETGFSGTLRPLFSGPTSPGMTSEMVHYFLAEDLERKHDGGGVGDESIAVHIIALEDLDDWLSDQIGAGKLIDPKVYAALYHLEVLRESNSTVTIR